MPKDIEVPLSDSLNVNGFYFKFPAWIINQYVKYIYGCGLAVKTSKKADEEKYCSARTRSSHLRHEELIDVVVPGDSVNPS